MDASAVIGTGSKVWAFVQIREGVKIGRACIIGNGAYIDSGVRVGDRCNIHNRALLYRNLTIEDDVFVGPMTAFLNDPLPRANRIRDIRGEGITVRRGASIGAGVQVLPNVKIGRYAVVAAGSVVTRSVPDHALVAGNPARIKGFVDTAGNRLEFASERGQQVTLSNPKKTFSHKIPKGLYETILKKI